MLGSQLKIFSENSIEKKILQNFFFAEFCKFFSDTSQLKSKIFKNSTEFLIFIEFFQKFIVFS